MRLAVLGLDVPWPIPFGCERDNPQISESGWNIKTIFCS
jgi:hypothetical protein